MDAFYAQPLKNSVVIHKNTASAVIALRKSKTYPQPPTLARGQMGAHAFAYLYQCPPKYTLSPKMKTARYDLYASQGFAENHAPYNPTTKSFFQAAQKGESCLLIPKPKDFEKHLVQALNKVFAQPTLQDRVHPHHLEQC